MSDSRIDLAGYDFIDVGASSGGAMDYARRKLGWGRGIGIDLDPLKVAAARQAGREVVQGDATKLDEIFSGKARFAIASHFLEHLPNAQVAVDCLRSIGRHVTEAVFVQQPTFDHMEELAALGLKLFWSDWSGHPNMMSTAAWRAAMQRLVDQERIYEHAILGYAKPIANGADGSLVPLRAKTNSHAYDPQLHGPRPDVQLPFVLHQEVKLIFQCRRDEDQLAKWCRQFGLRVDDALTRA